MLVLSRKVGEAIFIGDNISLHIVSISNDKVTLAIDAPKEVKIIREELLETIEANKDSNMKVESSDLYTIASLLKK